MIQQVFKHQKIAPQCRHYFNDSTQYKLTIEPKGLRFNFDPYNDPECYYDFLVPFNTLEPVLSDEGKVAIREILQAK